MKKVILLAFVALSMTAFAQHVTPLTLEITEVKIDSLRALYLAEPTMYRASLEVVEQQLIKDGESIKAVTNELKAEQAYAKSVEVSLKDASTLTASLKKIYAKEESELRNMQKNIEKQSKTINRQKELNQETRDSYVKLVEQQQSELNYAIREVAERQRALAELDTSIQEGRTGLQAFIEETQKKADGIAQLEATLKERMATIKNEQKAAKTM